MLSLPPSLSLSAACLRGLAGALQEGVGDSPPSRSSQEELRWSGGDTRPWSSTDSDSSERRRHLLQGARLAVPSGPDPQVLSLCLASLFPSLLRGGETARGAKPSNRPGDVTSACSFSPLEYGQCVRAKFVWLVAVCENGSLAERRGGTEHSRFYGCRYFGE